MNLKPFQPSFAFLSKGNKYIGHYLGKLCGEAVMSKKESLLSTNIDLREIKGVKER